MRVLSIKQPWVDAILYGGKRVENRTWLTAYRGPLALHASLTPDADAENVDYRHPLYQYLYHQNGITGPDERGVILAVADLVDCHTSMHLMKAEDAGPLGLAHVYCECDEWSDRGPSVTHLVLDNVRPLTEPLPWKGALGIRELPGAAVTAIERLLPPA